MKAHTKTFSLFGDDNGQYFVYFVFPRCLEKVTWTDPTKQHLDPPPHPPRVFSRCLERVTWTDPTKQHLPPPPRNFKIWPAFSEGQIIRTEWSPIQGYDYKRTKSPLLNLSCLLQIPKIIAVSCWFLYTHVAGRTPWNAFTMPSPQFTVSG